MHPSIQAVKNAISYFKPTDDGITNATNELLDQLGSELETENYEPGTGVEVAQRQLEHTLNEFDQGSEEIDTAIAGSKGEVVEDEDEEI